MSEITPKRELEASELILKSSSELRTTQAEVFTPTFPGEIEAIKVTACESIHDEHNADSSSVQVNLQTSGLAFQVQTQVPHNLQLMELNIRLELLSQQLVSAQNKLEDALRHVGFLEAQVLQRDQVIQQLCKNTEDT